ncbi:MAG TPA: response regulator, partial [Candidatus Angelobacter sp.]
MVTARAPTILCVDDKAETLAIRQHLLEQAGYLVVPATDASTALKLFKSQIIDLVISDHLLPDPTGAELTGQMKRQRPFVPVIIYSGVIEALSGTEHVDLFTSNAGGPSELLEKVAELLRPSRIAGGNYFAEIRCDRRFD